MDSLSLTPFGATGTGFLRFFLGLGETWDPAVWGQGAWDHPVWASGSRRGCPVWGWGSFFSVPVWGPAEEVPEFGTGGRWASPTFGTGEMRLPCLETCGGAPSIWGRGERTSRLGLEEVRFPGLGARRADLPRAGLGRSGRDSPRLMLEEMQFLHFGEQGVPKLGGEGSGVPTLRSDARGSRGPGCGQGMPYASGVPSANCSSRGGEKKILCFVLSFYVFFFPFSPFPFSSSSPSPPGPPAMRGRPPPPARRRRQPGSRLAPLIAPGRSPPRLKAAAPRGRGAAARPCVGLRFLSTLFLPRINTPGGPSSVSFFFFNYFF